MGVAKKKPETPRAARFTIDDLATLPPIRLDVEEVVSRGVVRVAFDAMRETPAYKALRAQDETNSDPRFDHLAGVLARRTATAHVARLVGGGD
jgi:hypothetical protein